MLNLPLQDAWQVHSAQSTILMRLKGVLSLSFKGHMPPYYKLTYTSQSPYLCCWQLADTSSMLCECRMLWGLSGVVPSLVGGTTVRGENRERAEMQEDEEDGPLARRRGKERMLAAPMVHKHHSSPPRIPRTPRVTPGTSLATLACSTQLSRHILFLPQL